MAAMAAALLVLLVAAPAVHAAKYTVGDAQGWDQGVDYTVWASDKTFTVGDTLEFTYTSNHRVDEVNESDYDACTTANLIKSNGGTTVTITLSDAGTRYFLCPTGGHCASGMKLKVDVVAATGGSPSTPTTPTTPGASSPPPSESDSPSGGGSTTPTTPSGSESSPPPPATDSGAWKGRAIGVPVAFAALLVGLMG